MAVTFNSPARLPGSRLVAGLPRSTVTAAFGAFAQGHAFYGNKSTGSLSDEDHRTLSRAVGSIDRSFGDDHDNAVVKHVTNMAGSRLASKIHISMSGMKAAGVLNEHGFSTGKPVNADNAHHFSVPKISVPKITTSTQTLLSAIRAEQLARRIEAVTAAEDTHCSAKAIVMNQLGQVLVLKDAGGEWHDLPGGRIHEGEDAVTGLAREVREETGLSIGDIQLGETINFKAGKVPHTTLLFKATALTLDVRLSSEHSDYVWVEPSSLSDYALGLLLAPMQKMLNPVAMQASTPVGHEFRGNQWTKSKDSKSPIQMIETKDILTNPNEPWSEQYAKEALSPGGHAHNLHLRMKAGKPFVSLEAIKNADGKVSLIDGRHRFEAAKLAGLRHVGVQILDSKAQAKINAQDATPDNYHEKARVVAEGIYKAEIDGWLSELNFKTVSGIKRKDDLDEIIAGLAAMGVAWFVAMMLAAKKARKTTARTLSAHQGFANTPDENALEAFALSRKQPLEAFPVAVREKVAASLKRGLAGGESPKALARRANEVFNDISEGAAQRVAATEAQVTYGVSQAEALALAGYRSKVWLTMGDDRVRDSHLLCEEQGAVPASSSFQNGLMFPGDPNGPPEEVINCRCNLEGVE